MRVLLFLLSVYLSSPNSCFGQKNEDNQKPTVKVTFEIENAGMTVTGSIQVTKTQFRFDPKDLQNSSILVVADPSTVETGISIRDKHLKRSDYFDVAKYPEIRLYSTGYRKTGKNKFVGRFNMTLKGITKEFDIPFTLVHESRTTIYQGHVEINRLDFNLGEKSTILSEKIKVKVDVTLMNNVQKDFVRK
jgi:polyisoprenoid-binding protein YceI